MNIMKKLAGLSLVVAVVLGGARLQAQDWRNFWLVNNTGKRIMQFYVSPHESGIWGGDVLGLTTLPDGEQTFISFHSDRPSSCLMDFKLVFSDRTTQTYTQGRDVCQLRAVQFNWDDSIGIPLS